MLDSPDPDRPISCCFAQAGPGRRRREDDLLQAGEVALEDGACELRTSPTPYGGRTTLYIHFFMQTMPPCSRTLRRALRTLEAYSSANGLLVDVDKNKFMKFGSGWVTSGRVALTLFVSPIETVSRFQYLGIWLAWGVRLTLTTSPCGCPRESWPSPRGQGRTSFPRQLR